MLSFPGANCADRAQSCLRAGVSTSSRLKASATLSAPGEALRRAQSGLSAAAWMLKLRRARERPVPTCFVLLVTSPIKNPALSITAPPLAPAGISRDWGNIAQPYMSAHITQELHVDF